MEHAGHGEPGHGMRQAVPGRGLGHFGNPGLFRGREDKGAGDGLARDHFVQDVGQAAARMARFVDWAMTLFQYEILNGCFAVDAGF